jgi:hypothetical protein
MGGGEYYEASYDAPAPLNNGDMNADPSDDVPDPFLDDPVPTAPRRTTSNFSGNHR